MRVLVTGASGHIGSFLVPELLLAGHEVLGLARSERSSERIRALGAAPVPGDLNDPGSLADAVGRAEGVIHLAFKNEEMRQGDLAGAADSDLAAIRTMGEALAGTDRPFVGTNGLLGLYLAGFRGELGEEDTVPAGPRIDAENLVISLAERGVRSSVVRLPPTVHADARFGFASALMGMARASQVSGYPGDGTQRWPSVHARDAARLYRLALEQAAPGSRLHAVAEEGIALRELAEAIGRSLDLPTQSVPAEEVGERFGFLAGFVGLDAPTTSDATRRRLDWQPQESGLLAEIARSDGD
jgi:nucleoside-diphosphate-sugar epimerase